jgi:hypothetical protein
MQLEEPLVVELLELVRDLVESSVELPDGSRVHYARSGPFDGPSVFFVHGWSDWSVTFRRVIDELPEALSQLPGRMFVRTLH